MKLLEALKMVIADKVMVYYHESGKLPTELLYEGKTYGLDENETFRLSHYTVNGIAADNGTVIIYCE